MSMLFHAPLISGLRYSEEVIAESEEEQLIERLLATDLSPFRFHGWLAGIGWHRDRDVFDRVVGFSLAAPATLRFRRRRPGGFDRANLDLRPRSAYLLSVEARWEWEHSIVPGQDLRFSITFRALSDKGRRIAAADT
jgi:hypothetical protein